MNLARIRQIGMRLMVWIQAGLAPAQTSGVQAQLNEAYAALRNQQYERAVELFGANLISAAVRKDLAYTYLKIGENEAARDQFAEVMRLDPGDHHAALEYAFLAFETRQETEARRVFDRVRKSGDAASRATAEQAFQNIDRALAEGIERWKRAVQQAPGKFSAHEELARLAEKRDDLGLAAEHYEKAWRLRPDMREFLLHLGRMWKAMGGSYAERGEAALLAASRSSEPRVAEGARQLLPPRYPYVYEFERALELDPDNTELRRELAYLLLEMGRRPEAEKLFEKITAAEPRDLLSLAQLGFLRLARNDAAGARPLLDRVLNEDDGELGDRVRSALRLPQTFRRRETPRRQVSAEAKNLGLRSLEKGYLKDALKYLAIAHEADPVDFEVILKLGWANNLAKQDREAVRWFDLARRSPDPRIAEEAGRAYLNLRPMFQRVRHTFWTLPFFSSRWRQGFAYGQMKTEFRWNSLPLRPYVSARFIGDTQGRTGALQPQYLSETAVILGAGVATPSWKGLLLWAEAGTAFSYLGRRPDAAAAMPDYRGGASFGRGFGALPGAEAGGLFFETNEDLVYVSRFHNNVLFYTQNRTGVTVRRLHAQFYWNWNLTADTQRQYWANFVETGPGVRLRLPSLPPGLMLSVDVLRGANLINGGNPRRPNYFDLRAGFWYALSR